MKKQAFPPQIVTENPSLASPLRWDGGLTAHAPTAVMPSEARPYRQVQVLFNPRPAQSRLTARRAFAPWHRAAQSRHDVGGPLLLEAAPSNAQNGQPHYGQRSPQHQSSDASESGLPHPGVGGQEPGSLREVLGSAAPLDTPAPNSTAQSDEVQQPADWSPRDLLTGKNLIFGGSVATAVLLTIFRKEIAPALRWVVMQINSLTDKSTIGDGGIEALATLAAVALTLGWSFSELNKMEKLEARVEGLEQRLVAAEARLEAAEARTEAAEQEAGQLRRELQRLLEKQ